MSQFVEAIADLLAADSTIEAALAGWDFGSGTETPAIFTTDAPEECGWPVIVISQGQSTPWGTRGDRGLDVSVSIRVWWELTGSEAAPRDAAHQVWNLLDRTRLTVSGWTCFPMDCDQPGRIVDPDGFPGYEITARFKALEN